MKLSVIVPTRNRRKLLKECLNCLLNQDFPKDDYEIIVVDDGSSDKTKELLETISQNIKYYRQETKGPAAARNVGVKNSTGNLIAFLDDDCLIERNWVDQMIEYHKRLDDTMGVAGKFNVIEKNIVSEFCMSLEDRASMDDVRYFKPSLINNTSFKKQVFTKVMFDESFHDAAGEDVQFNYRLYKENFKVLFAPNIVVKHHYPSKLSTMSKQQFAFGKNRLKTLRGSGDYPFDRTNTVAYLLKRIATPFLDPFLRLRYAIRRQKKHPFLFLLLGYIQQLAYWSGFLWGIINRVNGHRK